MPTKEETEPVSDDEWLYRRVHAIRFRTDEAPYVSPSAFEPRTKGKDKDIDGISLYRADCLEAAIDILALIQDAEKRKANGIVRITVAEIRSIGLTVVSSPREEIRGHVSIPELSSDRFSNPRTRTKCKEWMTGLATLASPEDRIVLKPEPMNPRIR